jgi:Protein of unknown function (DUF3313)
MRRALCLIAGLLVLTVATAAAPPPQSGFLDSYPTLQPDPKHEGSFIYMAPGASLKGLTKVQIDPILVWYSKDSTYQGIDPNELSAVTENLRKALIKNLEPKYPVVDADGPNVLRLRLAVTNVVAEKKKRGILGYTPVGFIIGAAKNAATAGPNLNIASATLEAELLDASGKRLAVVIDPLAGQDVQKENLTWADIGKVLDAAGKRLRTRLDSDNLQ